MSDCINRGCSGKKDGVCLNDFPSVKCYGYEPPSKTNGDRIRAMSDEELAKFCGKDVDACPPGRDSGKCIDELYARGEGPYPSDKQCIECWFNWLKQKGE